MLWVPYFRQAQSARNLHLSIRDVSSISPNLSKRSSCAKVAVILKLLMLYFVNYSFNCFKICCGVVQRPNSNTVVMH